MRFVSTRLTFALLALALGMAVIAACTSDDQEQVQSAASTAAGEAKTQVKDAWASMRTDGERMIDAVQTRNDPAVKQDLLDSCRNTLEKMRKADNASADKVDALCTKIRDTDPKDSNAWAGIKDQWKQLNTQFAGT